MIQNQNTKNQLELAVAAFKRERGRAPAFGAAAPGRVNLIGEHIDYNDGFVLPMAIDKTAVIVGGPNDTKRWVLRSCQLNQTVDIEIQQWSSRTPEPWDLDPIPSWARYPIGVLAEMTAAGWQIPGFEAVLMSNVPLGGGLSSSAAVEVATATFAEQLTDPFPGPAEKALLCQRAEHRYAGVPCGVMDQFSSVFGKDGCFMLIDCQNLSVTQVPFDQPGCSVLIVNSNVSHALGDSEYAKRQRECQAALVQLDRSCWREVGESDLRELRGEETLLRRARHVVSEIRRTREVAALIVAGEIEAAGLQMDDSHESLRTDYQVSCPEVDCLVEIAREIGPAGGVWGSRMTGGGFGGCTVSLVQTDRLEEIMAIISNRYQQRAGLEPTMFTTRPSEGAVGFQLS